MWSTASRVIVDVACPKCKKVNKPYELDNVFVEYDTDWSLERGSALITQCCQAIVVKSVNFDHFYWRNKGKWVHVMAREYEAMCGKWKFWEGTIITKGPQIVVKLEKPRLSGGVLENHVAEIKYPEY